MGQAYQMIQIDKAGPTTQTGLTGPSTKTSQVGSTSQIGWTSSKTKTGQVGLMTQTGWGPDEPADPDNS